ncbi:YciI family protein [Amycolatopsis australiensis]|uniref:Uncharacterized conserved protein n=1 Tax=Amycolatopsis australiensis TaxID=546364 RepID=A0A1K1QK86_9PSEU|nr:YciI family protein [Amycolatopsis australiensis]SFW60338.1 Uncharacterized conserved protein [Amycolatopsis australiensis]
MRFMVIVKANEDSEAGKGPSAELLAEMGKFNEALVKAGVLLAGEGLTPSSQGARVVFSGTEEPKVVDGPFAETKELVGGFWILQCRDREECIEWIKRMPNPEGRDGVVEIRRVAEAADFENLTPEVEELEGRLRAQSAQRSGEA